MANAKENAQGAKDKIESTELVRFEPLRVGNLVLDQSSSDNLFMSDGFQDESTELFSAEALESLKGIEVHAVIKGKVTMDVKEETKDFVEMHIQTDSGYKRVFAGQYKFLQVWEMNGCENDKHCLLVKFTYLGKEKISGTARTVNSFKMSSRKINLTK